MKVKHMFFKYIIIIVCARKRSCSSEIDIDNLSKKAKFDLPCMLKEIPQNQEYKTQDIKKDNFKTIAKGVCNTFSYAASIFNFLNFFKSNNDQEISIPQTNIIDKEEETNIKRKNKDQVSDNLEKNQTSLDRNNIHTSTNQSLQSDQANSLRHNDSSSLILRIYSNTVPTRPLIPRYYFSEECISESEICKPNEDHQYFIETIKSTIKYSSLRSLKEFVINCTTNTLFSLGEDLITQQSGILFYGIDYSYLFEDIFLLERRMFVRFDEIYKYVTQKNFRLEKFMEVNKIENDVKIVEEMENFFNNYFLDQQTFIYFSSPSEINYFESEKSDKINLEKILPEVIKEFNTIYMNYTKNIFVLFENPSCDYFPKYDKIINIGNPEIIKNRELFLILEMLDHPKNKILLTLFPEIKFFVERIAQNDADLYPSSKRDYIFFSFLTLKIQSLKRFLGLKHIKFANNPNFLFTKSKLITQLIFEMKAFISIFGCNFLNDQEAVSVMIYKTFLSFIRMRYPEILPNFIFNEFVDTNRCFIKVINANVLFYTKNIKEVNGRKVLIRCDLITLIRKGVLRYKFNNDANSLSKMSFHCNTCPLPNDKKWYNDYQINNLFNKNVKIINEDLARFIFDE